MENRRMSRNVFPLTIMKDDVVISGISGRFPESDSIDEFRDNLYNNVDMITSDDRRWPTPLYGMSPRMGKLKEIDKLDSSFFGIVPKVAEEVDPQGRILLETTYEAICDAGVNPQTLRGSNTGVYVGYTSVTMPDGVPQEVQEDIQASKVQSLFWFQGSSKAFYANRVSFVFDFRGPSMSLDVACAASMVALDIAVTDLRLGKCDQAIVAGVSINLQPFTNHIYQANNIGSKEGMSRVWDQDANGYVRGETVGSLFLQRKPDAKRIYATVLHSRSNIDGYKISGMFFPCSESQCDLMVRTYTEAGINPHDVNYFEGHGTGTKVGDPQEAKAILDAYCKDRTTHLPVGLLKSNIGHGEGASGVASLAKLLIVYENKRIPANLNLKTLKSEIAEMVPPLIPINENTDYEPGIAGVNSFGIGGVNCHALLKPNKIEPSVDSLEIADKIPRLVNICGRTEEAVNYIFEFIEKNPQKITRDFLALIGEIVNPTPAIYSSGFPYRGSVVIKKTNGRYQYSKKISKVENNKRPICYFFSGMGSQWTAMAKSLMDIEVFNRSIQKAATILKSVNIDLLYVLLSDDPKALDEKIHHFVAITSMQVALVDVFTELGISPDYVIGHSFGEIACGYADGCLTLEQAIITSYWRGKAIKDANVEHGMMAAVGLTWEETKSKCPTGVYTACHNSIDSVTISGAYNVVNKCVEQLVSENIFAREVQCANIPFHCPLLLPAAGKMTEALKSVIPDPKPRSSKWISTSMAESEWNTDKAIYASADYFVNNLINPVLFHDSSKYIPKDAIIIELAPHALFSAIFKRSMPSAQYLGLLKRNNNVGNLEMFITAIGQLYQLGVNVSINGLYPTVKWPVARSTQSISSLMKWDHNKSFLVKKYPEYHCHATASDFIQRFSLSNPDFQFLSDHAFDGKCVFPATGYLLMAWRRLASTRGQQWFNFPVVFENVQFKRLTPMSEDSEVKLSVRLLDPTGEFVVLEGDHVAASGRIFVPENNPLQYQHLLNEEIRINDEIWKGHKLDTNDFYTELNVRGFDYGPKFRQIQEVQYDGFDKSYSKVKFGSNWVTFVESLIQLYVTHTTSRSIYVSLSLPSLKCDPTMISNTNPNVSVGSEVDDFEGESVDNRTKQEELIPVIIDSNLKCIVSKGIEIKGLKFANIPLKNIMRGVQMEKYEFVPNIEYKAIEDFDAKELTDYITSCDLIVEKLEETFRKSNNGSNSNINSINEKLFKLLKLPTNDNQILLKLLIKLYENIFDENGNLINNRKVNEELIKTLIIDNNYDLSMDVLNLTSSNARLMRSILDIVNENKQRNISVAELNLSNAIMAEDILYNMGFYFHYPLVADYCIANKNIKNLPKNLQNSGYQLIDWDIKKISFPSLSAPVDLLVYKDSTDLWDISFESFTNEISNNVRDGGFILGVFRTQLSSAEKFLNQFSDKPITNISLTERLMAFENYAKLANFSLVCRKSDSISSTVVLLRKVVKTISPNNQSVVEVKFGKYEEWVEELKSKFAEYKDRPRNELVWLFANDSNLNGIIGLVNCLRQEPGGDRFRCIFSDGKLELPIDFNKEPFNRLLRNDLVINIHRDNCWGTYRLLNLERNYDKIETTEAYLDVVKKGDLSSIKWFDLSTLENICEEEVNVKIYYSAIDFRDLAVALGQLGAEFIDRVIGFEFAGRRSDTGERVMGISTGKSIATSIDINPNLLINIPDQWSIEDGASAISSYFSVWYSLINRAQLEEGETVLIHSGTDANGLTAIQVCQRLDCRIFVTASSDEKRKFLRDKYDISDAYILDPKDPNFVDQILTATNGNGVDVVFDSLSNDKLVTNYPFVANYGRYIEIDNYDQTPNHQLLRNTLYYNISSIISEETFENLIPKIFKSFAKWFSEGLENGSVQPINREVFKRDSIDNAFRHLSSGQSIGKVLIKIRDEEPFEKITINSKPIKIMANTKSWFDASKVYILVGGLGGLGLEVAYWMVTRGARKLVLVSRSGIKNDYQYVFVKRIANAANDKETIVKISTSDPSTISGAERLVTEASGLGPVGGIFHFATVLSDAFIEHQSAATFKKVCAPKVDALGYLDAVTRKFCPKLDYFVAFSSQSSGRGFVGQNNYGYANSVMEHICENRTRDGYHGLAIQYGPIGDVGLWAQNENIDLTSIGMVISTQRIPSCLEVLDRFLHCQHSIVSTIVRVEGSQQSSSSGGSAKNQIWGGIGIDMTSLADDLTLGDVGMESILAVEMQQRIEREYEVSLTTDEIKLITVGQIKDYQNDDLQSVKVKIAEFKKSLKK